MIREEEEELGTGALLKKLQGKWVVDKHENDNILILAENRGSVCSCLFLYSEFMDGTSPIKSEDSQITVEEDNPNQ